MFFNLLFSLCTVHVMCVHVHECVFICISDLPNVAFNIVLLKLWYMHVDICMRLLKCVKWVCSCIYTRVCVYMYACLHVWTWRYQLKCFHGHLIRVLDMLTICDNPWWTSWLIQAAHIYIHVSVHTCTHKYMHKHIHACISTFTH